MKKVLGKSRLASRAASVYSKPWANTTLKPREPKSRKASAKSDGEVVCTKAVSAPSLVLINCRPSNAAAFHPASLTGPGVSKATLNRFDSLGAASGRFVHPHNAASTATASTG